MTAKTGRSLTTTTVLTLRKMSPRNRLVGIAIIACLGLVVALIGSGVLSHNPVPTPPASGSSLVSPGSFTVPSDTTSVCGQRILKSPYDYDGPAGPYASGKAGLPTYGTPHSDFPDDNSGVVVATGTNNFASYQLKPDTVYYLLPGIHTGRIQADPHDTFVGGVAHGKTTILSGNYAGLNWAIDSNSSAGDQADVTIEYLTIEKYQPDGNSAAINPDSNTGWTVQYNTITLNVPGAGVILGADGVLRDNCLTLNGQYGFQSEDSDSWGEDALTGGPYNLTVSGNEISYNDTCDFSGLLNNSAIGWSHYNPVPARYRNSHCGTVQGDGDQGGFKLWRTNGATIVDNYIHNNWGVGGWADTNNANTTWANNTITNNEASGITEETSYNFSITNNFIAGNDITDGLANNGFPSPAIYISESGSDREFGGIPACPEASCSRQPSYSSQSVIRGNTLIDNGGNIFLWQNSNRYCSDASDSFCTLVNGGQSGPFTLSSCAANLPSASINTSSYIGNMSGKPPEDWWDGCMWRTENVAITHNTITFHPADIMGCDNSAAWPACGAGGIFSEYGSNPSHSPGWIIPTQLTFFQNDIWSDNTYDGPSTFYAWNQGSDANPVSWADWTQNTAHGSACRTGHAQESGSCTGPFGQDAGSTYKADRT
jgi:parallel beta helix pectate lyase-like protein